MKKLYLVRHGKSSWSFETLDDYDRPLGKRGRKDVLRMGQYVKEQIPAPDLILTSGASRAFYTALHFADYWKYPEEKIVVSDTLYHAGVDAFEKVIHEVKDFDTVALFGHNPGLTMFHNRICDSYIDNIPTCGLVVLELGGAGWLGKTTPKAKQRLFQVPKEL